MSAAGTSGRQRHQRLLPAYVAAVIFGIVGMYALMQHCPASPHVMAAASAAPSITHHADEHLSAVPAAVHPLVETVQDPQQRGGGLGDMLMLCAALFLGAGALLTLLLRRRLLLQSTLPRPSRDAWRPTTAIAGAGPPPTLAFAVVRC